MIYKLPDVQAGFRKGRGTRDQIANISWIIEKVTEFQKHIYFCFINYAEAFDCEAVFFVFVFVFLFFFFSQKTVENSSRGGDTRSPWLPPKKSVCRSRSKVRNRYGTTDWFQIGKEVHQVCILSPCLFNLYAEYIMRNAGLDEAQAGNQDCQEKQQ